MLTEQLKAKLLNRVEQLTNERRVLSPEQLGVCYASFRTHFGPDRLAALEGQALLETMHGSKEAMAYWLEHKKDAEFPSIEFGGIGGGSAMKFGVYRRKETGTWATNDKNQPKDISLEEAIAIAKKQRDQLLKGAAVIEDFPHTTDDAQYRQLQEELHGVAPDVADSAWGHKYFSVLYPDKIDDFHSGEYQRFYLLKLLQELPQGKGRYVCAGRFVALANDLSVPMATATTLLYAEFGPLHHYWKLESTDDSLLKDRWAVMEGGRFAAIGWPNLPDLSFVDGTGESTQKLRDLIANTYPNADISKATTQIRSFVMGMKEKDIVLACRSGTVLAIGKLDGGYRYVSNAELPHQRSVDWLSVDQWPLPNAKSLQSPVCELRKDASRILDIERRIQEKPISSKSGGQSAKGLVSRLESIGGRIQSTLERKGQVILFGPPGTGKTFWAEKTACELASLHAFGKSFHDLDTDCKATVCGSGPNTGLVRLCCFHSGYGYEDFIEGYRPELVDGHVAFVLHDGMFKRLCEDATKSPNRRFYLIVDEINRGDVPRIFGELLTVLEKDKREKTVLLPISRQPLLVPQNVYLIGTMNTADRSISVLDAALRRRFGFVELMPDSSLLKGTTISEIPLAPWFQALNKRICQYVSRDARHLQIGHSYFLQDGHPIKEFSAFVTVLRDDVIPLLEEYCYEDFEALKNILGDGFVDPDQKSVRQEFFEEGKEQGLIQMLLELCTDVMDLPELGESEPLEDSETDDKGES
jgi:5-methylcytosine-specific restriction enzyme B